MCQRVKIKTNKQIKIIIAFEKKFYFIEKLFAQTQKILKPDPEFSQYSISSSIFSTNKVNTSQTSNSDVFPELDIQSHLKKFKRSLNCVVRGLVLFEVDKDIEQILEERQENDKIFSQSETNENVVKKERMSGLVLFFCGGIVVILLFFILLFGNKMSSIDQV